ncbi:MAG: O-methyltransferase family 3 [Bacteroidetes bacterium]|nr:O-methyltransferase family 3 [Bacteroidota bacterium]
MSEKQIFPFIDQRIENYCQTYVSKEDNYLSELNEKTKELFIHPHMISGNWQGTLLSLISNLVKPKYILELGTFSGYSALCLVKGLAPNGKLHTIEWKEEYEEFLLNLFKENKVEDKIQLHIGKALDIIPTIEEEFDIVFIDADKANYPAYYDLCIEKLRKGGLMIADNVLWYGKIALETMPKDKHTVGIHSFNQKITEDPRMENLIIPLRDGLMIGRKI